MRNLMVWSFCLIFAPEVVFGQANHWESAIAAAEIASGHGQYREAESQFVRAEQEAESFGQFDHRLAMTLNNLGKLDLEENRLDDARRHCEEALQAYRQLAQKEPGTYLPDLATTLYNLGYVDQQQKRRDESRQNLEEALKIYRQLAQKNPRAYLGDLQDTASLLGTLGGSGTTSKSPGGTARRP